MKVITTFFLLTATAATAGLAGVDFVRYDDAAGAFSISLPSGYTLSKSGAYPRYFSWADDNIGLTFVSVNWADGAPLTADEVKEAYESYLGVESDLNSRETIVPDDLLPVYGADDGLRGRYYITDGAEETCYRVSFLDRRDRVYTFIIAVPAATEEETLDVIETVQNSVILLEGD
ncbi:MAG: hypothetical protein JSW52_08060 [Candidatus Coatesbacteria bacterium]|nr:MAG: hypothetical protein JSW52_08060 [Candidatus Coatesbacteria bacterium]